MRALPMTYSRGSNTTHRVYAFGRGDRRGCHFDCGSSRVRCQEAHHLRLRLTSVVVAIRNRILTAFDGIRLLDEFGLELMSRMRGTFCARLCDGCSNEPRSADVKTIEGSAGIEKIMPLYLMTISSIPPLHPLLPSPSSALRLNTYYSHQSALRIP